MSCPLLSNLSLNLGAMQIRQQATRNWEQIQFDLFDAQLLHQGVK